MFYCNKCAKEKGWPKKWFQVYTRCEICKENKKCYDVPFKELPKANREKKNETQRENKE